MLTRRRTIVPVCFLLLFGCSHQNRDSIKEFSLDGVDIVRLSDFSINEKIEIGFPLSVNFFEKGSILISERKSRVMLGLYDIESGERIDSVMRGRGPGECLGARVSVFHGKVFLFDSNSGKIVILGPDSERKLSLDSEVKELKDYLRIIPSPSGGFLALPYEGGRFERLTQTGEAIDIVGSFPPFKGDEEDRNNMAAQSLIAYSPDGEYVCSPFLGANYIDIYKADFSSMVRLWGPDQETSELRTVENNSGVSYTLLPDNNVFSGICAFDKGFLVGYINQDGTDGSRRQIKDILYFDWRGNLLKRLSLSEGISCFDYDSADGRLVAISADMQHVLLTQLKI